MNKREFLKRGIAAAAYASFGQATLARAASYPSRPIRCIVGYPPGGTTDIVARLLANALGKILQQTIIVENKPGAGGSIGASLVAHADPDGYTLGVGSAGSLALDYVQYRHMPYDSPKDFTCITNIINTPNVMMVNSKLPVKNLRDLIAYIRNKGGGFFGNTGVGNGPYLTGELFKLRTGLKLTQVPYQGSAPEMSALLGGQVDIDFDNLPSVLGSLQGGQVRAIAVSSAERISVIPNVETFKEQGMKDFVINAWFSLIGPAGLDPQVTGKLSSAIAVLKKDQAFLSTITKLGGIPDLSGGTALAQLIESERKRWTALAKTIGIHPSA